MLTDTTVIVFALILALAGCYRLRAVRLPLPPGPKGYPVIGNLFDMPFEQQWVKYREWAKRYNSDIIHLRVLGNSIVVLNSQKAANDLLSVRSRLYSDRSVSTMINELLGWGGMVSLMPYGHAWRTRRRAIWQEFNPDRSVNHRPKQLRHARDLLRRLLKTPQAFLHHIDHTLAASMFAVAYGIDVKAEHDPHLARSEKAFRQLQKAAISGSYMVDFVPVLKYVPSWIPGAGFKAYADRVRADTIAMIDGQYEEGCRLIQEGREEPSLLSRMLAGRPSGGGIHDLLDIKFIKDVTSQVYGGGAETSHAALSSFVAAMVLYPDVQRKGQEEIEALAFSRLPTFEDLPHLPYVHAIMLEILRWQSILPLGIAHRLTVDDEYNGYLIPKGSIVFANIWAILQDEAQYRDPDTFNPERFLKDGQVDAKLADPLPNFGFGRRICPGRFFAMDSLWISMASILATFNIAKAKGEHGRDIEPDIRWIPGFSRHLAPFPCSITPRSQEAVKLIQDSESV
ncbi:cytochrome P450 family protein [Pleurotus pulmonarius]